jgi:DNA repair photolyase
MAKENLTAVFVSITTLRADLTRIMEPRTSVPKLRLAAVEKLARANIPVGVMVAPVIPGLTDEEMPGILKAAAEAGAITAGYVPVRLPFGVKELFEQWLADHMPDRKEKILNRIRAIRDGKLNDSNFHTRMRGDGVFADQMKNMFEIASRKAGIPFKHLGLCADHFRVPQSQLGLF